MKQAFHTLAALLLIVVMNVYVLGVHSSSMPSMLSTDAMSEMKYGSTPAVGCITICPSTTTNKLNEEEDDDKKDDTVGLPFYVSAQQPLMRLKLHHTTVAREIVKYEPPPGLPAYIAFTVFRT